MNCPEIFQRKKKTLRQHIKKSCRVLKNLFFHSLYDASFKDQLYWDGSKEGLSWLSEHLLISLVNLSEKNKSFLVQPPIFERSIHNSKVEKAETFARSFIGASYYLKANFKSRKSINSNYIRILEFYKRGIIDSFQPASKDYWGYDNHLLIENTAIIVGLMVSEEVLWDTYSDSEKATVLQYFETYLTSSTYDNNWIWFKIFHYLFLEKYSGQDFYSVIKELLCNLKKMMLDSGWYADGYPGTGANIDYYSAWAFQYYFLIFQKYSSVRYCSVLEEFKSALCKFSETYKYFFTSGGTHPIYGRSQLYRFATLAPFGYLIEDGYYSSRELEYLKNSLVDEMNIFLQKGACSTSGYLTMGILSPSSNSIEHYSGSGSPYWAMKAFSMLLISDNNHFWAVPQGDMTPKDEVVTIEKNKQVLARSSSGRIFLLDGFNSTKVYGLKYNKFIYKNIKAFENLKDINWNENSLQISFRKSRLKEVNIIKSRVENGKGYIRWTFDKFMSATIESFYIMVADGYFFHHKFFTDRGQELRCHLYGVVNPCGDMKFKIMNNNIRHLSESTSEKLSSAKFSITGGEFISGACLEKQTLRKNSLITQRDLSEEMFFDAQC